MRNLHWDAWNMITHRLREMMWACQRVGQPLGYALLTMSMSFPCLWSVKVSAFRSFGEKISWSQGQFQLQKIQSLTLPRDLMWEKQFKFKMTKEANDIPSHPPTCSPPIKTFGTVRWPVVFKSQTRISWPFCIWSRFHALYSIPRSPKRDLTCMQNGQVDVLNTMTFDDLIASDACEAGEVALAMSLTPVEFWEYLLLTRRPLIVDKPLRGEWGVRKGRGRERVQPLTFGATDETERVTAGVDPIEERSATEALLVAKAMICLWWKRKLYPTQGSDRGGFHTQLIQASS